MRKTKNEIHEEIMSEALREADLEPKESKLAHPLVKLVFGIVFIMLIILIAVPYYSINNNPSPKNIPELSDFKVEMPKNIQKREIETKNDYLYLLDESNPDIKTIASRIASKSCLFGKVCHAKAIYGFVRDNIKYVSDPRDEYVESAMEVLYTTGADCDGMAVLLANLLEAVGIHTRFVFVPNHVYVQAKLPQAISKYKDSDDWVSLDATCKTCEFGAISYSTIKAEKKYVERW